MMMQISGYAVEWNQLIKNGDFSNGLQDWLVKEYPGEVSYEVVDGVFKETLVQPPARTYFTTLSQKLSGVSIYHNMIYISSYVKCWSNPFVYSSRPFEFWGSSGQYGSDESVRNTNILKYNNSSVNAYISTDITKNSPYTEYSWDKINIMNLTQMFGSGNEPTAVSQFEDWLRENNINPDEYIPYCAGETRLMTKPSWII